MIDLHSLKIGDKAIVHTIYGDYIDTVEEIIQDDEDVSPYKEDKQ